MRNSRGFCLAQSTSLPAAPSAIPPFRRHGRGADQADLQAPDPPPPVHLCPQAPPSGAQPPGWLAEWSRDSHVWLYSCMSWKSHRWSQGPADVFGSAVLSMIALGLLRSRGSPGQHPLFHYPLNPAFASLSKYCHNSPKEPKRDGHTCPGVRGLSKPPGGLPHPRAQSKLGESQPPPHQSRSCPNTEPTCCTGPPAPRCPSHAPSHGGVYRAPQPCLLVSRWPR